MRDETETMRSKNKMFDDKKKKKNDNTNTNTNMGVIEEEKKDDTEEEKDGVEDCDDEDDDKAKQAAEDDKSIDDVVDADDNVVDEDDNDYNRKCTEPKPQPATLGHLHRASKITIQTKVAKDPYIPQQDGGPFLSVLESLFFSPRKFSY